MRSLGSGCLSYFLTAVMQYPGKSKLKVKRLILAYSSRGLESITPGKTERQAERPEGDKLVLSSTFCKVIKHFVNASLLSTISLVGNFPCGFGTLSALGADTGSSPQPAQLPSFITSVKHRLFNDLFNPVTPWLSFLYNKS